MNRSSLGFAVAILAGHLGSPALAYAQADAAFRAGLSARDDKRWQVAATEMRRAIQADPKESDRRVGGGLISRGTQYLPYFFLGEALFQQQDCAGAVEAWAVSERQGAIKSRPDFVETLQSGYATCASRGILLPAEYDPLLASTRLAITDVTALAQRLSSLGQARRDIWRPEMHSEYERARAELQTAQTHLAAATRGRTRSGFAEATAASDRAATILRGLESIVNAAVDKATQVEQILAGAAAMDRSLDELKGAMTPALAVGRQRARGLVTQARSALANANKSPSPAALNEALRFAHDASAAFSQLVDRARQTARDALQQRLAQAVAAADESFSFVDASLATLDRLKDEKPGVGPANLAAEREQVDRQVAALRRRFEAATKSGNLAGVEEVVKLTADTQNRLQALVAAFGPLSLRARGVHPGLEEGARLFLAGEHEKALSALNDMVASGANAQPFLLHVHLFRAAAGYALYVRSGEADLALFEQAAADVQMVRQLNPGFEPDPGAFAPRFIAFFQTAGRPPQAKDAPAGP